MIGNAQVRLRNDLPLLRKRLGGYAGVVIKVGPSDAPRRDTSTGIKSNAQVGAIHEKNLNNWGFRSFLKFPLEYRFQDLLHGFRLDEEMLWDDPQAFPRALGKVALVAVDEAFETQGWGQWTPLSPETIEKKDAKGNPDPSHILVDTSELRQSITFEVT